MQHKNRKGFLLVDALITVFVTSLVCIMCYAIYRSMLNYENGYDEYQIKINDDLLDIYQNVYECEACIIDESD